MSAIQARGQRPKGGKARRRRHPETPARIHGCSRFAVVGAGTR
jgi:hypothetical protein